MGEIRKVSFHFDLCGFRERGNHWDTVEGLRSPDKQKKRLTVNTSLSCEKPYKMSLLYNTDNSTEPEYSFWPQFLFG